MKSTLQGPLALLAAVALPVGGGEAAAPLPIRLVPAAIVPAPMAFSASRRPRTTAEPAPMASSHGSLFTISPQLLPPSMAILAGNACAARWVHGFGVDSRSLG